MNRYRKTTGAASDKAEILARRLKGDTQCSLHLSRRTFVFLKRSIRVAGITPGGCEALRRLKGDGSRILALAEMVRRQDAILLPGEKGCPRVLALARLLVDSGEARLQQADILSAVGAFNAVQEMRMQEIHHLGEALHIALCEALSRLSGEILFYSREMQRAENWVQGGGGGLFKRRVRTVFYAHALKLASELEKPDLHAYLENRIDKAGSRSDFLVEQAHAVAAEHCLRLDNLLHLGRLLEGLDWEECFERLCASEQELREDPAEIYARMDAASRDQVRRDAAELAREAKLSELTVVRYALQQARSALEAHGPNDPRSTVCWYLSEDEGRLQLCAALGRNCLRRCIPDAGGRRTTALVGAAALLMAALLAWMIGNPLLAVYALPLAWVPALQIVDRIYPRYVTPRRILKLKIDHVPDSARTLVVLPVLLSSRERVEQMLGRMETLGCMENDANIDFLLLGDFKDACADALPEDDEILCRAREGVDRLNQSGRHKYFYLHRSRSYREQDGRWMGKNRKRGALMALNSLLLNRLGAGEAFCAEGRDAAALAGRYRYVVTLDADTEYLPGTLQKLIGAMLHPLNHCCTPCGRRRGYAVLQPAMQMTAEACANAYVQRRFGEGGLDGYPFMLSEFFQDMTGRGSFAGKGIYDVRAFALSTENVLNDDVILSHDLIEGILSGAGGLNDVFFFDGCPDNLRDDLQRLNRWTRGDWQLLPVLFSRLHIGGADRLKMLSNLLRSLYAPSLLGLLVHSAWLGAASAFAVGLLLAFHAALLYPGMKGSRRSLLDLAVLPAQAFCQMDAILRTLWRLAISKKHLMDWVPAADAGGTKRNPGLAGRICVILLLPALLRVGWIVPVLALGALFWVGADWAKDLSVSSEKRSLSGEQSALLLDLACRTWRFFEEYVPMDGCGLPPDNVQLDPPAGIAMRTSPTNIGLYLMSCLSARRMGFITRQKMLERVEKTTATLEKLEKWQGHLYNWYDLNSLMPLRPGYISAVDSGNLAGALLLCAHELRNEPLSGRILRLAEEMNLAALYDSQRNLFFIGMDAEDNRMSRNHYDLYASESRILSYCAMMLGQVPLKHWQRLGRTFVRCGRHSALLSWSGTMFETLMPELLLRCPENTLAGENRRGMVACQMDAGRAMRRPWGVSESGHYAFDLQLNYQYRAFGLKALAMDPAAAQDVVAPYAAALALMVRPAEAADNLKQMCDLGWMGELGMYEAADYQESERPRIVRSHMAHHQGMALCAICNVLCDNFLSRSFMDIPQARALHLLLEERIPRTLRLGKKEDMRLATQTHSRTNTDFMRKCRQDAAADVHLLRGNMSTVLVTHRGGVFAWKDGLQLNRFFGDLRDLHHGMFVHLADGEENCVLGDDGRGSFDAGCARFQQTFRDVEARLCITVSPEDGTIYQQLTLRNKSGEARSLQVTGCMAVALAEEKDMRAHPVFQNLFVQTNAQDGVLLFSRRSREAGKEYPQMIYLLGGAEACGIETNLEKLVGRTGALGEEISGRLSGSTGNPLNPCGAIQTCIRLQPNQQCILHFALTLAGKDELDACIRRIQAHTAPERALQLCAAQTRAMLGHTGVEARLYRLLQRSAALVFDPQLRIGRNAHAHPAMRRDDLWRAGISGDLPLLLVEIAGSSDLDCMRDALRIHAFYRNMGVKMDFVIIDHQGSDYMRPTQDALGNLIASSHLNGSFSQPGGAFALERENLDNSSYAAIVRVAALRFDAQKDCISQLQSMLDALQLRSDAFPMQAMQGNAAPAAEGLRFFNGYGGFSEKGYVILLREGALPPAPWSNVLAAGKSGAIVTERGGGFAWHGNSRHDRLTPFANDPLQEGWGWMFYLMDEREESYLCLLPGNAPMVDFTVCHEPGLSSWAASAGELAFRIEMRAQEQGVRFDILLENHGSRLRHLRLAGLVNWLMGTDGEDASMLRCWQHSGACFASGAAECIGVFACDDPQAKTGCDRKCLIGSGSMMQPAGLDRLDDSNSGWTLHVPIALRPGERRICRFLLGGAADISAAYGLARDFRNGEALRRSGMDWQEQLEKLQVTTPDEGVNLLANGFLQAQAMNARILGRTGLYQGGGAYGFRDQLQDMLPMIHYAPEMVRKHLLKCAARQFEAGDVLHWWHDPYTGVRTRISDDLLFLPFVTARYVVITGDEGVLQESIPFLQEIPIPEGKEDVYARMQPTAHTASLHRHCMLAFRRAARTGRHGLCRMGSGDWNDGMNRIGVHGEGESIWLSQFLAVCAAEYAQICPNGDDRAWLLALNERLLSAIEEHGWDGRWYLRAYADDGQKVGSSECACCRIDLISQAWSVLAGLDENRSRSAMDQAWEQLADEEMHVIRLLTPPFNGSDFDPGYIAAYPPGVRENGAQYTHAACWMLCALARQGDAQRAHRALQMLLPMNHARTREEAEVYRVEPYVMAADIYTGNEHAGRGGWTWYTGSAAWMLMAIWMLLGFERRKNRVRLHALLHDWPQVSIRLRYGLSSYTLICGKGVQKVTLDGEEIEGEFIEMTDDGRDHTALFPPRSAGIISGDHNELFKCIYT